jgi:metal-sulfur cluster biosynthetic enzyme
MIEIHKLKQAVEEALSKVIDPETGLSISRMDLIQGLAVTDEGEVSLVFRPSSPVCPMAYALANSIRQSVASVAGVAAVRIGVENYQHAKHLEDLINAIK